MAGTPIAIAPAEIEPAAIEPSPCNPVDPEVGGADDPALECWADK